MVWNPFRRNPHDTIPDPEPVETVSEDAESLAPTVPPPPEKRTEQEKDVVEGHAVEGFDGLDVAYTIQKKMSSMGGNTRNDDAALADAETGLLGVFDGLGGVPNSHLASAMAVRELPQIYSVALRQDALLDDEEVTKKLATKIRIRTDENIAQIPLADEGKIMEEEHLSEETVQRLTSDPELTRKALALLEALEDANQNIGALEVQTTACVAFIHKAKDGTRYAVAANVGDSAAFILYPDQRVEQITREDSYQNELLRKGELTPALLLDMKRDPHRHFAYPTTDENGERMYGALSYYDIMPALTRRLGGGDMLPTLTVKEIPPGAELVLCTDGVVDKYETKPTAQTTPENVLETSFDEKEFAETYLFEATPAERVNALRFDATQRKSYKLDDDIAIVAAHVKPDEPKET